SFYSGCCGLFVPDDLTTFMTHHAVAPLAMPVVLVVRREPAGGSCRPYLCQVGRTVPCCRACRHACRTGASFLGMQVISSLQRLATLAEPTMSSLPCRLPERWTELSGVGGAESGSAGAADEGGGGPVLGHVGDAGHREAVHGPRRPLRESVPADAGEDL
ncbi:hypothetical protein GW17_00062514, partial [Ensete ventricosum]